MLVDDVASNVCPALPQLQRRQSICPRAGPGRYCSPHHRDAFETSRLALKGILRRGERYMPGPTREGLAALDGAAREDDTRS